MSDATSPRPWHVVYDADDPDIVACIIDAEGGRVVPEDSTLRREDAEMIVRAVNLIYALCQATEGKRWGVM